MNSRSRFSANDRDVSRYQGLRTNARNRYRSRRRADVLNRRVRMRRGGTTATDEYLCRWSRESFPIIEFDNDSCSGGSSSFWITSRHVLDGIEVGRLHPTLSQDSCVFDFTYSYYDQDLRPLHIDQSSQNHFSSSSFPRFYH